MSTVVSSVRSKRPEPLDAVTIPRTTDSGEDLGTVTLDPSIFSVAENATLVHQVVTAQLAARRSGTQSTKTRAEVKGGSAKPYRQKGTGNARQGTIRAPHYAGGGVALGPKPRDYSQKTPRKMIQHALNCALSDRARAGAVRLIDRWTIETPKTKDAVAALDALDCPGRVLVVVDRESDAVERSLRNIPGIKTVASGQLVAADVLVADVVVFTDATLPGEAAVASQPAKKAPVAKAPAAKRAPAAKKAPAAQKARAKAVAKKAPAKPRTTDDEEAT